MKTKLNIENFAAKHTSKLNLYRSFPSRCYDLRTREGKEAFAFYKENESEIHKKAREIQALRIQRREAKKHTFENVLTNSLYLDYCRNRHSAKLYSDRIKDGLRNHWAANDFELKILAILKHHKELSTRTI